MSKKKKMIWGSVIGCASLLLIVYIGVCVWFSNHFFPGTTVNGVDCSNRTPESVAEELIGTTPEYALKLIELDGAEETIQGNAIGTFYEYPEVYEIQKNQNIFLWFIHIFQKTSYEVHSSVGGYDEAKLQSRIGELHCVKREDIQPPVNAEIRDTENGLEIVPETLGNQVDQAKLKTALDAAIRSGVGELKLENAECYAKPAVTMESPEIKAAAEAMERLAKITITYDFRYKTVEVGPDKIKTWVARKEDGTYEISRDRVAAFVAALADAEDTVWRSREFCSTSRGWIWVEGGSYGWQIDQAGEVEQIFADLNAGQDVTREPRFFMDPFPGAKEGSDIGDTYVEMDLGAQHMWFYKNGSLFLETDITTGTMSTGHGTPAGVYFIENRLRDTRLVGETWDTQVSYWMEINGPIGIHDATWRSAFGGNYYLTDGSHGCINTPYDKVEALFNNIEVGTPVVVYY